MSAQPVPIAGQPFANQGRGLSSHGLGVAIIGAGMIGEVHRRSALAAGSRIAGVLASSPDSTARTASRWGTRAYSDLDHLLASDVDVVHICTPNASHHDLALAALAAGKHVVCEKPLGVDITQAHQMAKAAHTAKQTLGLVTAVPFVYRYHPLVREIRARVERGDLGALHLIHGSYLQDWLLDPGASSWRVDAAEGGASRAFADIGSHWMDLVEWVSGHRATALTATTAIAITHRPTGAGPSFSGGADGALAPVTTEDAASLLLCTDGGAIGNAVISQVSAGRKNRLWFEVDGEHGSAVFDQEAPESIWLGGLTSSQVLVRDPGVGDPAARRLSVLPAGHAQGYAQCFEAFVADVHQAVRRSRTGSDPHIEGMPTFADGLRAALVTDAVLTSAGTGRWTPVVPPGHTDTCTDR